MMIQRNSTRLREFLGNKEATCHITDDINDLNNPTFQEEKLIVSGNQICMSKAYGTLCIPGSIKKCQILVRKSSA